VDLGPDQFTEKAGGVLDLPLLYLDILGVGRIEPERVRNVCRITICMSRPPALPQAVTNPIQVCPNRATYPQGVSPGQVNAELGAEKVLFNASLGSNPSFDFITRKCLPPNPLCLRH
jgi:hypothetical protein